MIKATINGIEIELEKPVTILEAAKKNGIKIPHLCHHKVIEPWGGCRMCLVEVERMPKMQTACTLFVTEGMIIRTESEQITKARRAVLEFLLINHPLDCPVCDKAGECKLQDYVMLYGPTVSKFKEAKIKHKENISDPLIARNPERCILCTRCVRMCSNVQGASAIAINNRGNHSLMEPFSGNEYNCEYCGNCLTVCPVGAIMSKLHRFKYRSWQVTKNVETICSYCGVGCTMTVQMRDNDIMRTIPEIGVGLNKGLLCSRGRFGYEYVQSKDRLTTPYIRKNGKLEPASWNEAFEYTAKRLLEVKSASGSNAIAGIAGARCTNEENYMFQKVLRGLGSNNVDSIARVGYAGSLAVIEGLLGSGATANQISEIAGSDMVLVPGDDPSYVNPVLGLQIRSASRKGANVITLGYAPGLDKFKTLGVNTSIADDEAVLSAILGAVVKAKGLSGRKPKLEALINAVPIPPTEASQEIASIISALSTAKNPVVVIGRDAGQRSSKLVLIIAIAYVAGAKIYLMSERPNEQGAIDAGCTPDMLPGGASVTDEEVRKAFGKLWQIEIPSVAGLSLMEIIDGAKSGSIKAMYVMGENPAFNLPDNKTIEESLGKLDLLIVQDIFMTETAKLAHVVLPAASWTEKEGTYTNLERRIQRLRRSSVNPAVFADWEILVELGVRLKLPKPSPCCSEEAIFTELSHSSPLYTGLKYKQISNTGGASWPYNCAVTEKEMEITIPGSKINVNGNLYLSLEKPLFHSGSLSRNAVALNKIYSEALVKLNPATAKGLGLADNDMAVVSTEKGSIKLKVKTDASVNEKAVLLSNNFEGKGLFGIVGYGIEPVTKAPVFEGATVTVKKES